MFNLEKKIRVALLVQVAALSFSISQPARAITEAQLFNEPAFVNLYGVILRVNTSMKIAAMNPMDRWRRQAVREAVAQIPPALIGLAEVFESGKLHDGDYQYVMGMLGGFVDQKSAPEIYSKFLKKPSADLIPKAGSGMQARLDRESGSAGSRLVYDDNAPSPEGKNAPATAQNNRPQNKEVVNLSSLSQYDDKDAASSSSKIVYDESAAAPSGSSLAGKSKSAKGVANASSGSQSAPTNSFSGPNRAPASSGSFVSEVQSEISVIEAGVKKDEQTEEELLPLKRQTRAKAGRPAAKPSVAPKQGKPVSQNTTPSRHFASMGFHGQLLSTTFKILPLFYLNAFAGEGQSNCQSCQKGGGQGGGEGGGGGGGGQQAAQLLFGAAAIMAAIVPAIVAAEQADADKEIAQTNAEAQKYMTDAVARNSENLAAMQQQTAMYQTQVAAQTAAANNEAVTQRLNQQLQQLDASQQRIAAQEQQQFAAEQELNQKRLQLSEAQLAANVAAAQAAQQLQLTQAGLSTGTLPGDSGSTLTTSSTGVALASTTGAVAATAAATGTTDNTMTGFASAQTARAMASTNSGSASPISATGVSSSGYASGATGRGMTGASHETPAAEGAISKPPSDTVVMADTSGSGSSSDSESGGSSLSSTFASLMPSAPVTASARLASSLQSSETNFSQSSSQESQISRLLKENKELNGSSRGMKVKAAPIPQSSGDLRKFIAANDSETKVESESFAQFQEASVRHQSATRGLASTAPKAGHGSGASKGIYSTAGRPAAAAYNPPAK